MTSNSREIEVRSVSGKSIVSLTNQLQESTAGSKNLDHEIQRLFKSARQREYRLIITVVCLSILCFALLAIIIISGPLSYITPKFTSSSSHMKEDYRFLGICDSIQCVDVAHRTLKSANFSSDPCEDFHHFACSKWQVENPIREEQLFSAANFQEIRATVDKRLKNLLESSATFHQDIALLKSPKAFYQSCLKNTNPNNSYIISDLVKSFGGYRRIYRENKKLSLTDILYTFLKINAAPIFDVTLNIDSKNRSRYVLVIDLPRSTSLVSTLFRRTPIPFPQSDLYDDLEDASPIAEEDGLSSMKNDKSDIGTISINLDNIAKANKDTQNMVDRQRLYSIIKDDIDAKRIEQLQQIARNVANLEGIDEDEMDQDVEEMVVIAWNIKRMKPTQRQRKFWKQKNKIYNKYTIDNLNDKFSGIEWETLFEKLLLSSKKGQKYQSKDWDRNAIYIPYPYYLRRVTEMLKFTDERILFNAMMLFYIRDMLTDLNPKIDSEENQLWKICIKCTKSAFPGELSSLYMRSFSRAYLSQLQEDVQEIFTNVKESLVSLLKKADWHEDLPRRKEDALKKVRDLKGNFIGPSFYFSDHFMNHSMVKIDMDESNFYSNIRKIYELFRRQLYDHYWDKVDENKVTWAFVTYPFTVNAFYIQQFNSMVIPLGFLNPPHYTTSAPKYINYATLALTIAHEALHSLDGSGSDFDSEGKFRTNNGSKIDGFLHEKGLCVAKQYSKHFKRIIDFHQTQVSIAVDGNLTQNENLADIVGLQVAYKAYLKIRKSSVKKGEEKIPGLNYNLEQIYFITVAQAYCANVSPLGYVFLLEIDEHTPHPERINGMLMNIEEFSEAFQCPEGSRMNPHVKCHL